MKKFNNIVIATDLDGTFFGSYKAPLVKRNLEAVKYFTDNGGKFTIATGRAPSHVMATFGDVAQYVNAPAIVCNGACFYDYAERKMVTGYPMDSNLVADAVELVHKHFKDAGVRANSKEYEILCTPGDLYHKYISEDIKFYTGVSHTALPTQMWRELVIYKLVVRAEVCVVEKILPLLYERFGDKIEIAMSSPTIIDMQLKGHTKGTMLAGDLRKYVGENAKIYACGDFFNDEKMLMAADVAVCPSNAHEHIKEISDLCLCSNEEGLIADLVEHIENEMG